VLHLMTVDDLPPASLEAKLTYRISRKLEVFYTGGAAKLTRDGRLLACACSDEVKVRKSRSRFQMIVRVMSR